MTKGGRQSSLLVEIVIAVLFFAMSATVILNVFAAAYRQSSYAGALSASTEEAQDLAERLYLSDDPQAMLAGEEFVQEGDTWHLTADAYDLAVELMSENGEAGELRTANITVLREGETLIELPLARYIPREVAR